PKGNTWIGIPIYIGKRFSDIFALQSIDDLHTVWSNQYPGSFNPQQSSNGNPNGFIPFHTHIQGHVLGLFTKLHPRLCPSRKSYKVQIVQFIGTQKVLTLCCSPCIVFLNGCLFTGTS